MRLRTLFYLMLPGLIAFSSAGSARAASSILVHSDANSINTVALCMAAPNRELGSVVIHRIRVTSSRATPMSYVFVQKRTSDAINDTDNVSSCTSSNGCETVISLEGVQQGEVSELDGLSLVLPRGSRLYMYTDVNLSGTGAHQTIEVSYQHTMP